MSKDIFKKGHQKTGEKSSTLKYCPAKVRKYSCKNPTQDTLVFMLYTKELL